MEKSKFVYVTYIRTTPEKLWQALTEPDLIRQYFFGVTQESDWKLGAAWRMIRPDGTVTDSGEVLEIEPNKKLVLRWRNEFKPEFQAEGDSRMTYGIETEGEKVKLTVIHEIDVPQSKLIEGVSGGWPYILSSLKSFLETGAAFEGAPSSCGSKASA